MTLANPVSQFIGIGGIHKKNSIQLLFCCFYFQEEYEVVVVMLDILTLVEDERDANVRSPERRSYQCDPSQLDAWAAGGVNMMY